MRSWLGKAWEDLKDQKNLETYVAILIATVAALLSLIDGWLGDGSKLESFKFAATLGLLGVLSNGALEIRRGLPGPDQGLVGPVWRFFAGRRFIPDLDDRIEASHKSVTIFGVQLNAIVHTHKEIIRERAAHGVQIQLAMLSPFDKVGAPIPWIDELGEVHSTGGLRTLLATNLSNLKQWRLKLPEEIARNIEIRCYREIPTASVILYDVDTKQGYIHVEPIMTHLEPSGRPVFWLREKDDPSLYSSLASSYRDLWDRAIPVEDVTLDGA